MIRNFAETEIAPLVDEAEEFLSPELSELVLEDELWELCRWINDNKGKH